MSFSAGSRRGSADANSEAETGGVALAGSIMGGMFLKEFVQADTRWAHIDIAGTAWSCSATGYRKSGGSSFGVRTLINAVEHIDI